MRDWPIKANDPSAGNARICDVTLNICSHRKTHFNKKSIGKVLPSFDELEARTLVWNPNAMVNDMFRYDCGEGF